MPTQTLRYTAAASTPAMAAAGHMVGGVGEIDRGMGGCASRPNMSLLGDATRPERVVVAPICAHSGSTCRGGVVADNGAAVFVRTGELLSVPRARSGDGIVLLADWMPWVMSMPPPSPTCTWLGVAERAPTVAVAIG